MVKRPKSVAIIAWLLIVVSTLSIVEFLTRMGRGGNPAPSLVGWWFALGMMPLYFISAVFMLRGKDWARQLYLAVGGTSLLFELVALPFAEKTIGTVLFFLITALLLYRPYPSAYFLSSTRKRAAPTDGILGP